MAGIFVLDSRTRGTTARLSQGVAILIYMNVQLTLIESVDAAEDWKIDTETREIGRQGLQSARQALASARAALSAAAITAAATALPTENTAGYTADLDLDESGDIELPAAA